MKKPKIIKNKDPSTLSETEWLKTMIDFLNSRKSNLETLAAKAKSQEKYRALYRLDGGINECKHIIEFLEERLKEIE